MLNIKEIKECYPELNEFKFKGYKRLDLNKMFKLPSSDFTFEGKGIYKISFNEGNIEDIFFVGEESNILIKTIKECACDIIVDGEDFDYEEYVCENYEIDEDFQFKGALCHTYAETEFTLFIKVA